LAVPLLTFGAKTIDAPRVHPIAVVGQARRIGRAGVL
jgi:hypothetical protein